MAYNTVGQREIRVDAVAKVTGKAKYTADFRERDMLVGKILRSPYAHAWVRQIHSEQARALPGVEAVLTYADVPHLKFSTAGHPYSLDPGHRDKEDRLILTDKARFVGDAVAAVVAESELIAEKALQLIEVEYEPLEVLTSPEAAMREDAPLIHEAKRNILSTFGYEFGDLDQAFAEADRIFEGEYQTSVVQHCQLENQIATAQVDENGRIVITTSTQIPHIVRRIVAQALGIPWGKVRVLKPCIGGGFGNKQDVCVEPLAAAMTLAVGGRPVRLELSREECMIDTRTRHAIKYRIKTGVKRDGKITGIRIEAISNTGAYASHGHSIASSGGGKFRYLYQVDALKYEPVTVYTNLPVAGAMRGYGTPQIFYAFECHMEDIARGLGLDPIALHKMNFVETGFVDPIGKNKVLSCGIRECVDKGREMIKWDQKKKLYKNQSGDKRRGLGMACFSYQSGTHPVNLEIAGARIVLNQDGSVQLQVGATEIGQGSDTVFGQMAAEVLGLPLAMVHVISTQDTDVSPFDTGAYASRQTYISGMAVKKAAEEVKAKILDFVWGMTDTPAGMLDLKGQNVVYKHSGEVLMPLAEVALQTYYDPVFAHPITSDTSSNARVNAMSYGVTFAEVEVDLKTGKVEVLEIYNVHDSGRIINPQLAEGQVHGGVSMGIGYALSEQLLYDEKTGRVLNNNLLDYKLPTIMDTPEIGAAFVELDDPTGPFGVKSLGEPPAITPAPAIRNAVLDATGVAFNRLPMNPQRVFEKLRESGIVG
ncbi:Aldehyde oxidase and xanthine dehydrogenase, a/b hammerhead domain protein [Acididesulfobacillus acetoxydans]|uniref:Aldehyde oxidase and xanthine dehydrogenase, a/b hammerhead domain protein n=1 Tax=Acididesulfobacillus acetoxydans TaxID=1561005 RepID=A0A8S0W9Z3_9FIRM|nr:xanthine dehydrogenase molybdenum-binding subunit XdhA [Acididesulfobacillus acetoxydans]CAA7602999.1 Aldehyde oxidase and xanthine dehydrogenase, a/b hammerhead domain protein [Acididesulfobacillus acetoxydans]CEJ05881.1 Xanthine dehydrogenase molybdenum-binding subunit [Acididesulfobacillus acetoxydans]